MEKKGFTIIEVVVVFCMILAVAFFVFPISLDNTKHARLISSWSSTYSNLEYIFSVLKAQNNLTVYKKIDNANSNEERQEMVLKVIKPYFRTTTLVPEDEYKIRYMNGLIAKDVGYHFKKHYYTSSGKIIALDWLVKKCSDKKTLCGIMSVDINGIKRPNTWGEDIFGIGIYSDRIQPLGKDKSIRDLKLDCSKDGQGILCSYYYLIGGKFD
ncbi:hypothetical protein KBA27_04190 [bacterium]|nr:hypothetical protein [bacterium]